MGFVQSASNKGTAATLTVTLGSNSTVGNCLVGLTTQVASSTGPTVSSVKIGGNADSWAVAKSQTTTDGNGAIWTDQNCQFAATAVLFTYSSAGTGNAASVIEWNGVNSSGAVDKAVSASSGPGTTWSSGTSGTLSQASEVAFGLGTSAGTSDTLTGPSSPWTNLTQQSMSGSPGGGQIAGYQQVSATTALTYSGTGTASDFHTAIIVTLKLGGAITVNLPLATINTAAFNVSPPIYVALPLATINTAAFNLTPGIAIVVNLPVATINTAAFNVTPTIPPSVIVNLPLATINTAAFNVTPTITPKIVVNLPVASINTNAFQLTPVISPVPPQLLIAIAARAGVDPYAGYPYPEGFTQFASESQYINMLSGIISFVVNSSLANAGTVQSLNVAGFLDLLSGAVTAGDTQSEIFLESRDSGGGIATVGVDTDAFVVNANESIGFSMPTGFGNITFGADGISVGNGSSAQLDLNPRMATPTNLSLINAGSATAAQICAFLSSWYSEWQNRGVAN